MQKHLICPKCSSKDYITYVFVQNTKEDGTKSNENPGDEHFINVCPSGHVFLENEEPLSHWIM